MAVIEREDFESAAPSSTQAFPGGDGCGQLPLHAASRRLRGAVEAINDERYQYFCPGIYTPL